MTTAITRQAIRRELYNQIPGLGLSSVADSLTATTLTDAFTFRDSNIGTNHYRGYYIYRPDLSGDDTVKKITTVAPTTGVATHGGSNWSDTSDTNYELLALMHPDELNSCIKRAMKRIYYETQVPHCGVLANIDGDMETSGTTNWTNTGLATLEKTTTATRVYSGTQVLHTLANSADDYVKTAVDLRGFGNTEFYASTIVHVDVGSVSFIIYDVTNSLAIGTATTSSEEGFVHLWVAGTVPATCEELSIRLNCVTSTTDAYWNHVAFYPRDRMLFPLPSWVDESWKFLKLREARYLRQLSGQTRGGYDDAYSRIFADWIQPSMFTLDPLHLDANPYQVQLMRRVPENELWIQGKRPFSDSEPLTSDSSTTRAPERQVYAYAKDEIAKVLVKRYPTDQRWRVLQDEALNEVDSETRSRTEIPLQPIKREHYGSI